MASLPEKIGNFLRSLPDFCAEMTPSTSCWRMQTLGGAKFSLHINKVLIEREQFEPVQVEITVVPLALALLHWFYTTDTVDLFPLGKK